MEKITDTVMRKVGFIPNPTRDTHLEVTYSLARYALEIGFEPIMEASAFNGKKEGDLFALSHNIYEEADFLVALGGDGTVLSTARKAAPANTPLMGINMGRLGYLTDATEKNAKQSLRRVREGNYKLEKRMMLEAIQEGERRLVLNDVTIERGCLSRMIEVSVEINGEYMDTYHADGIIIATPTGSTAYNLSAGGPILKPDSQMIAITPICPHALYARSSVISSEDVVKLSFRGSKGNEALVSLDGQHSFTMRGGKSIAVARSDFYTTVIKTNNYGFYDILREKLMGR